MEAFGYRNISVEGFEADDVIAALTEQAKERGIPVMVVTGDRDAYQLVDDGVRIMSTSRGVTDTKVYDREGVIERYGIPPELIPDFIGLKGDTSDNIPGVPGIGDKTAADLLQRFGDLESVLASVDQISGAKRKENLTNHADDARMSKQLAIMVRDVPIDIDLEAEFTREPDRTNLRAVFRDWELRDPLRRLEEALDAADLQSIPRPEDVDTITVKTGLARHPGDIARLQGDELTLALTPPEIPEGELIPREPKWRYAAYAGGNIALAGETDDPALVIQSAGDRPVVAHDAKALGDVPPKLVFDTAVAGYLLDPARRGYPLDELAEERGIAADAGDELATIAVLIHELAKRQRPQISERGLTDLMNEIELPLVHVLRECEKVGVKLDTKRLETVATRIKADVITLEREIWDMAGEEFMIGSPQQLGTVLFDKLKLSRKRRGKTGFSHGRPRAAGDPRRAPDHPQDRALPGAVQARPDLPGRAARTGSARTAACTRRSSRPRPPPAACPRSTRTCRTSRSARRPAARSAPASSPSRASPAQRRLRPGRAARPRPHRRRAGAQGHLRPRRGRAHRDRERRLRAPAGAARRGHALEGQDGQLRDRLRAVRATACPTGCGSRRRRRRSSSTATWSASRPSPSS